MASSSPRAFCGRRRSTRFFAAVAAHARKYRPSEVAFTGTRPWESPAFDATLIRLRAEEPRTFGRIYDTLQTAAPIVAAALGERVADMAAAVLGDDVSSLAAGGVLFRMDVPGDTRNRLDWHQERSYYPQNEDGANGAVAWIALRDVDETGGTIMVCPGSHREGFIRVVRTEGDAQVSQQFRVPDDALTRHPAAAVPVKAGDGVFFHMNLFHASGTNRSDRVRFTLGARFHRATAHDFRPGRFQYVMKDA
jgi:hypothetical protein